jgi:hypothetical protein
MMKVMISEISISPMVQGMACPISCATGVGKEAVDRPKSSVSVFLM